MPALIHSYDSAVHMAYSTRLGQPHRNVLISVPRKSGGWVGPSSHTAGEQVAQAGVQWEVVGHRLVAKSNTSQQDHFMSDMRLHRRQTSTYEMVSGGSARLRNDLCCVEWDVKLYYTTPYHTSGGSVIRLIMRYIHSVRYHLNCKCRR